MDYTVSHGIAEGELSDWLKQASKKYGTFKDGRVDYTDSPIAPIVMCTVLSHDEILLVKRGYGLADAEGYWSTVNGFIDEIKPVEEFATQELSEEIGLKIDVKMVKKAGSYTLKGMKERRTYIVFPCLINLAYRPQVKLNDENTDFVWIKRDDLKKYHTLSDLSVAIDSALALL